MCSRLSALECTGQSALANHRVKCIDYLSTFFILISLLFSVEQSPQRCYSTCEPDTSRLCRAVVWATPYLNRWHHRGIVGEELVCACVCEQVRQFFTYECSTITFHLFFIIIINSRWTWKVKWRLISIKRLLVKTRTCISVRVMLGQNCGAFCIRRVVCSRSCVPTASNRTCAVLCCARRGGRMSGHKLHLLPCVFDSSVDSDSWVSQQSLCLQN